MTDSLCQPLLLTSSHSQTYSNRSGRKGTLKCARCRKGKRKVPSLGVGNLDVFSVNLILWIRLGLAPHVRRLALPTVKNQPNQGSRSNQKLWTSGIAI